MNHKQWVTQTFDRAAPQYGGEINPCFDYFGKRLVELAQVAKADRILDVATGKGAVLFPASRLAEQSIGIDLSSEMLAAAKKRMPHVELLQMDAEQLDFPDQSFDVVFCAFALFFFPHLPLALSEFKRVMKSTGRLAVSIWGPKNPLEIWASERTKRLGASNQLRATIVESEPALKELLTSAGFSQVSITHETKTFRYKRPEDWWESLWGRGFRSQFEQLSAENLDLLRNESLEQALRLMESGSLGIHREVFYAVAKI